MSEIISNVFQLDGHSRRNLDLGRRPRVLIGLSESAIKRIAALRPPPPEENLLVSATPVLLYQVSWGRNAWHSTWISRYKRNTICQSWNEARKFVNERRKQGSAYRLLVTPGWHLQFDRKAYLVVEINTSNPFKRLLVPSFIKDGVKEACCLKLLNPSSEIWIAPMPDHDSIIVQETKLRSADFVAWDDHTSERGKPRTPGQYKRVIDGSLWRFLPVDGGGTDTFNTSGFAVHLSEAIE